MTYLLILAGIAILLTGGELLVRNASRLSLSLGVTPLVVGLTVVALGTSAPEMMTSVYSQWIGQGSVAIGNVIGSNLFNLLGLLSISGLELWQRLGRVTNRSWLSLARVLPSDVASTVRLETDPGNVE